MRMTPSLPQRGEAAQGEHPLDPCFLFFPFYQRFFTNLLWSYLNMGDAHAAGVEVQSAGTPKSVRDF